jgi:hypothetical protein
MERDVGLHTHWEPTAAIGAIVVLKICSESTSLVRQMRFCSQNTFIVVCTIQKNGITAQNR